MREVATTLSDFLLAILCLACTRRLVATGAARRLPGGLIFFAGMAGAALAGGIWHGWFSDTGGLAQAFLWWLSLLFAGITSAGLLLVGMQLAGVPGRRAGFALAATLLAVYAIIAWRDPRFTIALLGSAAGILACAVGIALRLREPRRAGALLLAGGLALSLAAAIGQQRGVALAPPGFDHNVTYHLLLVPALVLVYAGFRRLP